MEAIWYARIAYTTTPSTTGIKHRRRRREVNQIMPLLSRITIYPVKSWPGYETNRATILPSGALANDRRWAIFDAQGRVINAKRTAAIHRLNVVWDDSGHKGTLTVSDGGMPPLPFDLQQDLDELEEWLSTFFQQPVQLKEERRTGFPDDLEAPGPTLVSTSTLLRVCAWFPGLTLDECRRRFRANLETDAAEPFWEDRLLRADRIPVPFTIGTVRMGGVNPCQRCVVPTRDSMTGAAWPGFAQRFAQQRAADLPDWSPRERFDHFYRLTLNTVCLEPGQEPMEVSVGDQVIAPSRVSLASTSLDD